MISGTKNVFKSLTKQSDVDEPLSDPNWFLSKVHVSSNVFHYPVHDKKCQTLLKQKCMQVLSDTTIYQSIVGGLVLGIGTIKAFFQIADTFTLGENN